MLASANLWMGLAGLVYLVAGVFLLRKEIGMDRGWEKLIIPLGPVFIAASLAAFAPEHFRGPEFVAEYGPIVDARARVLGVFCRMRIASGSHQSRAAEVRTPLNHLARANVLLVRLHPVSAVRAQTSHKSICVDLHAERPLVCRRRVGSRRTAQSCGLAATIEMDDFIRALRSGDCSDLLWRAAFSSSPVCAWRAVGGDDAVVDSQSPPSGRTAQERSCSAPESAWL